MDVALHDGAIVFMMKQAAAFQTRAFVVIAHCCGGVDFSFNRTHRTPSK